MVSGKYHRGLQALCLRFQKDLESPQLPEAEQLIDTYARIKGLSDQELITRLQPIGKALKNFPEQTLPFERRFSDMIESGKYLNG